MRVTGQQIEKAAAAARKRFGPHAGAGYEAGAAGVGRHGECVPRALTQTPILKGPQRDGQHYYCNRCRAVHEMQSWGDLYWIARDLGIGQLTIGSGFSFAEALQQAEAHETRRTPSVPVVQLHQKKYVVRMPQERRTRARSTPGIPPPRLVTGQHRKHCRACGAAIAARTRCNACALKAWRATHQDQRRTQDQRYRTKRPAKVRALVRARVAKWRKRNRTT